jgi:hypothetical protein
MALSQPSSPKVHFRRLGSASATTSLPRNFEHKLSSLAVIHACGLAVDPPKYRRKIPHAEISPEAGRLPIGDLFGSSCEASPQSFESMALFSSSCVSCSEPATAITSGHDSLRIRWATTKPAYKSTSCVSRSIHRVTSHQSP